MVDILTKSSLIERDFDLLEAYKTPRLGMTLTTVNRNLQKVLEPQASNPQDRLNTLKKAREKGIKTYVFLGPLIPEFTDTPANLEALFRAIAGLDLDRIYVDRLNPRWGVLESLKRGLGGRYYTKQRLMVYKVCSAARYQEYSRQLRQQSYQLAKQFGLSNKLTVCF